MPDDSLSTAASNTTGPAQVNADCAENGASLSNGYCLEERGARLAGGLGWGHTSRVLLYNVSVDPILILASTAHLGQARRKDSAPPCSPEFGSRIVDAGPQVNVALCFLILEAHDA